tara:strand:- start:1280 stop:1498 length:219 start_codon:yes stop_codon:yes gene_type:complete
MPRDQLENLVKVGKLKTEPASDEEIAGLMKSGLARLEDAGIETLSIESRFDLAYNCDGLSGDSHLSWWAAQR